LRRCAARCLMPNDPLLDKVPPHSPEAEMSVLGAMLLSTEAIGIAVQYVDDGCFYRPAHGTLFKMLVDFYNANKPVDLVLVEGALRDSGKLEEIGGRDYLIALADAVPTLANAEYYARVVKDKALLRGLIQAGAEIVRDAHEQGDSVDQILDRCEQRIFAVTERKIVTQAYDVRSILAEMMPRLTLTGGGGITGLATGLADLDNLTRGLQPSEMIVLAARPAVGKSALALNIAEHVAVDLNQPVAFFSLEMSKEELALRLLSSRAQVDGQRLRKNMLSSAEVKQIQDCADRLYKAPLYIDDTAGLRVLDLRAKARRMYLRHKIKLIIVDYLQLMSGPGAEESRQVEVANISRSLKALARELKVPVLAVAQLRRPAANQPRDAAPQISDLRESGAIEQDADVVLLLDRASTRMKPDEHSQEYIDARGKAELIIGKQRNGPTGIVHLTWRWSYTKFASASGSGDGAPPPHEADEPPPEANLPPRGAMPERRPAAVQHNFEQIGSPNQPPPDDDAAETPY
jgi:replicative DNA helicase